MTKQWVENDTLILIDDVVILVEAKAGTATTIASPALDFARHAQAVQDLVVKAYKQCKQSLTIWNPLTRCPIFRRANDKYVECGRLRQCDYRLMLPIGLLWSRFAFFNHV